MGTCPLAVSGLPELAHWMNCTCIVDASLLTEKEMEEQMWGANKELQTGGMLVLLWSQVSRRLH